MEQCLIYLYTIILSLKDNTCLQSPRISQIPFIDNSSPSLYAGLKITYLRMILDKGTVSVKMDTGCNAESENQKVAE